MVATNLTRRDAGQPEAPLVKLFPYQREGVLDPARFALYVWSRQTGKDFSVSLKHVRKRVKLGGDTICIAAGQRQTILAIEKVKMHAKAMQVKFDYEEIEYPGTDEYATQVVFKNSGGRIKAMPANPDTVRGETGDVWLNEYAFMKFAVEMWKAAFAIATRGYSVDVSSTPHNQSGKFYEVCRKAGVPMIGAAEKTHWTSGQWSVHWCDVHTAIAQGYPIDAPALKEAIDDDDTWLQEYELHFLADAENYIPLELVIACESDQAGLGFQMGEWKALVQGPRFMGVDIGRRKDRTILWIGERVGDVFWTRAVETLERTPFKAQRSIIEKWMPDVHRCCIDETGLGMQLAEELKEKFGSKVEAVTFNIENKERMATLTKKNFEDRTVRVPSSATIRRAVNAVKRYSSPTGHFRFDADRTDAGHADEFWALALALSAASGPTVSTEIVSAGRKTAASAMAGAARGMGGSGGVAAHF